MTSTTPTSSFVRTSISSHHRFTGQLDAEWARLRHQHRATRQVRGWATRPEVTADPLLVDAFEDTTDLQDVLDATQRTTTEGADHDDRTGASNQLLRCLVDLAATEQLAGRIIVQRLLPALVVRAARLRFKCDGANPAEVAVPALWIAIHQYDTERRPTHVAAGLVADAMHIAFRKAARRRSADERTLEPASFEVRVAADTEHAFLELAGVVREARGAGVPVDHLDLIRHLLRAESPSVTAAECGITPRALRNRRDRAVASIRGALDAVPLVAA